MPTFAFPGRPHNITIVLLPAWNAPLPVQLPVIHVFGDILYARLLSTPGRSTSELLRTL